MAFKQAKSKQEPVKDYRHKAKRPNNPPVGMASYEPRVTEPRKQGYAYDPHLSPQLVWAGKAGLNQIDVEEQASFEVDTVSLHIHERVSTSAIVRGVRRPEVKQLSLFADPALPLSEAVEFYQHEITWTNRLILGDSLLVMNSLLQKELMAGKVQMIYLDPPYGVKFASNFQPRVDQRDVKDDDPHLTREPEQIKAYRDTWTLGVHSYLTYLRDRLLLCRELLTESGSIFVQIGDENVHAVRCLMDEVFGSENFCSLVSFKKTGAQTTTLLPSVCDYVLWYAKAVGRCKYRPVYRKMRPGEGYSTGERYDQVLFPDGRMVTVTNQEAVPQGARFFQYVSMSSNRPAKEHEKTPRSFHGRIFYPPANRTWSTTDEGFRRAVSAGRVYAGGTTLRFMRFLEDFPANPIGNLWEDFPGTPDKVYVVQTNARIVERCLLMTTDPGDLVLDPTCGSGTAAYVAEQWGRRWITMDTSRVALAIARQRLMTATFPYYELVDKSLGVAAGFVYTTVPHITLKSIANNADIDTIAEKYQPQIDAARSSLNRAAHESWQEWEVPREAKEGWGQSARAAHEKFWTLKRQKQREIDDSIERNAPKETLYNDPNPVKGVVRVSGPFTVEAIPPAYVEEEPSRGGDGPDAEQEVDLAVADSHIPALIELLRKDGVTLKRAPKKRFSLLTPRRGGILHAEGEDSEGKRVAVSFGPLYGQVTACQVEEGIREANLAGFDELIFCGFAFDAAAQGDIQGKGYGHVQTFMAHIRPDVLMQVEEQQGKVNLLKTTASSQLFTVFGDVEVKLRSLDTAKRSRSRAEKWVLRLVGVDVYDPMTGKTHGDRAEDIAAWFVDTDYDGRSFCVCQAFFPRKGAWEKLQRALKGTLDEDVFEKLAGTESLPFAAGEHRRAAVKVIDQRGDEVMKVVELSDAVGADRLPS